MAFTFGAAPAPTGDAPAPSGFTTTGNNNFASTASNPAPNSSGFSFGGTTAANTTSGATSNNTPAPSGGGFSFGGAGGATPTAAAPATSNTAPAPGGDGSGVTFGGTAPGNPSDSNNAQGGASAPSTGGFNFSGGASSGATAASTANAPAFSFGGPISNAPGSGTAAPTDSNAPAPSPAFAFGATNSSTAPTPAGATTNATAGTNETSTTSTMKIPEYDDLFPSRALFETIDDLLATYTDSCPDSIDTVRNTNAALAGQEIISIIKTEEISKQLLLENYDVLNQVQPDAALRQRLAQNPTVTLNVEQPDGTMVEHAANLTPKMLQDVFNLADDLQISEQAAICMYHEAAKSPIRSDFVRDCLKQSSVKIESSEFNKAAWVAREMYIAQRSLVLRSCLILLQHRMHGDFDTNSSNLVVEATDILLQKYWIENLIKVIRGYSQKILQMVAENRQLKSATSSHFWRNEVALKCCIDERQLAAECLFFIAYNVQLNDREVISIIDLVQELTANMPILDPYNDVPNPFMSVAHSVGDQWMMHHQTYPQEEKDPLVWGQELVRTAWETGLPQLLRCSSTLLMALISAFTDRAVLMDRVTHSPNIFGKGNALLPPNSSSFDKLRTIHEKLNRDVVDNWKRPDVLGMIMSAYALLLRSSPSALSSPRGASPAGGSFDVRKSWHECLTAAREYRSFTFARLSVIPALQKPVSPGLRCDVSQFLLSTLAEYSSRCLEVLSTSGDPPISRAKWEEGAEDDLRLRRAHQEQQRSFRGQFGAWSAGNELDSVPSAINLLDRPDCMDDIVAFSAAVCSLGPQYAMSFWEESYIPVTNNENRLFELLPSQALREIELQQSKDDTLRSCFISFLASIAKADHPFAKESGATVVHRFLSDSSEISNRQNPTTWSSVLEILRWYVRELNPRGLSDSGGGSKTSAHLDSSRSGSTSYYYFNKGGVSVDASNGGSDTGFDSSSRSKTKELGETNKCIVLSHLSLLRNVGLYSAPARSAILAVNLPVRSSDGSGVVGQDSTLAILFALSVMPLSPFVRGSVFETIASLLSTDSMKEEGIAKMRETALEGWDLLDHHQILPIHIFEQYQGNTNMFDQRNQQGLVMPQSSITMAMEKRTTSWDQADRNCGIIYEMECVESVRGFYPSTVGFLQLLASLFTVAGSPARLGQQWRSRPGCLPYVEYIMDYILPRVVGRFEKLPPLPFHCKEYRSFFVAKALQVIEVTLTRYVIPVQKTLLSQKDDNLLERLYSFAKVTAENELGSPGLASAVASKPVDNDTIFLSDDFDYSLAAKEDKKHPSSGSNNMSNTQSGIENLSVPRAQSPSYGILARLLSPGDRFFESIVDIFVRTDRNEFTEVESFCLSLSQALYASTPPTFAAAKEGARRDVRSEEKQALLQPLAAEIDYVTTISYPWSRQVSLLVVRILCAAIARVDSFHRALKEFTPLRRSHVPVLRFRKKSITPKTIDLQFVNLAQTLLDSNSRTGLLVSIIDCIGVDSSDPCIDSHVALAATAVIFYVERRVSNQHLKNLLCSIHKDHGGTRIANSVAKRLDMISKESLSSDIEFLRFIINRLLLDLRAERQSLISDALVDIQHGEMVLCGRPYDCVGKLLNVLSIQFIFGIESADVTASCYELIFRLAKAKKEFPGALAVSQALRSGGFWKSHLTRIFSGFVSSRAFSESAKAYAIHSIAWLLKGTANELHILAGFSREASTGIDFLFAPKPNQFIETCFMLFSEGGAFFHALDYIPICKPNFGDQAFFPDEASVAASKTNIAGDPLVVQDYAIIDGNKLFQVLGSKGVEAQEDQVMSWAESWNITIVRDCASAHLSDAIHTVVGAFASTFNESFFRPIRDISAAKLLISILERMEISQELATPGTTLDHIFYPTACRNLALAALMASNVVFLDKNDDMNSGRIVEKSHAVALLIRTIAHSGEIGQVGQALARRNQRIASLAAALLLAMRKFSVPLNKDFSILRTAASILLKLAGDVKWDAVPATPSAETLVARRCLIQLIHAMSESFENNTFDCREILMNTGIGGVSASNPIKNFVNLLPSLESDAAVFLQDLLNFPGMAEMLLESGLLDALAEAARKYCHEEDLYISSQRYEESFVVSDVQTPNFVLGHFELMSSLMAVDLPREKIVKFATQIAFVLSRYQKVIDRLISRFPTDGNVLQSAVRCIFQLNSICPAFGADDSIRTGLSGAGLVEGSNLSVRRVVSLCSHVVENPLPLQLLGNMPACLNYHQDQQVLSGVVAVIPPKSVSWWDSIPAAQNEKAILTEDVCLTSAAALDLARSGLILAQKLDSTSVLSDLCLTRALYQCSKTAVALHKLVTSNIRTKLTVTSESSLLKKLLDIISVLLIILLVRIRDQKKLLNEDHSASLTFFNRVAFVLDHTRIDILTAKIASFESYGDENDPDLIGRLLRAVREEIYK